MNISIQHAVLLLICIISRLLTTIYYIEDPDSLRFALSIYDFNLAALQPHFPGYPVFCFIARMTNFITGNYSMAFSVVGGISLYVIIIYALKLIKVPIMSLEGGLTAFLIFFNPMIWLMSNRYMPDLLGTAVMMASFYYLVLDHESPKSHLKGWILVGILAGIRLSYLPFMVIPCIYSLIKKEYRLAAVVALVIGIMMWMIPLIKATGLDQLIILASQQTVGHFSDFGGTIFTEPDNQRRIFRFFQNIWADGLGGFWTGRNLMTIVNSLGIAVCLFFGLMIFLSFNYPRRKLYVFVGSAFLYGVWVYFFQNVLYTSRHFLPFIPFFIIVIGYGIIYFLVNFNHMAVKVIVGIFLISNVWLAIFLAIQHKGLTSIAQVKNYLSEKQHGEINIVSIPLINFYLYQQGIKANFYSVDADREKIKSISSGKIITVGFFPELINKKPVNSTTYHHNPYVNRIWPDIAVFE